MLSIKTIKSGKYYADLAQNDDYYHRGKEPPGYWHGRGAQAFGLIGEVERKAFLELCAGVDPNDTRKKLVHHAATPHRRPGWDMCFSAPKSVSALWATAPDELREKISECQREAVKKTLDYAEEHYGRTRIGKTGKETEQTKELFFALFEHSTSRALDPQLHTHAVLLNIGITPDGKTRTLETNEILPAKMMLGAFYRAEFAHLLQRELGVELERGEKGTFEIVGVSKDLMDVWSTRRAEIEAELKKRGLKGAEAAAIAALETRTEKEYPDRIDLFGRWRGEAATYGFDYEEVINRREQEPRGGIALYGRFEQVEKELTKSKAYFTERDFLRKLAEEAPHCGATLENVLSAGNDYFDGRAVHIRTENGQKLYTTKEILEMEMRMLNSIREGEDREYKSAKKWRDIRITQDLSDEQWRAVEYITTERGQVKVISGMAGAGKTTTMTTAREIWEQQGYEVKGASLMAVAAENLEKEAGIKSTSIAKLLTQIDWYEKRVAEALGEAEIRERTKKEKLHDIREKLKGIYAEYKYATWQMRAETKQKFRGEYYQPKSEEYHEWLYATWRISKEHRNYLNYQLWKAELKTAREEGKTTMLPGHPLNEKTVLVIDEAGMVGTKQMARLVEECRKTGARLILTGDEKQLQPIEQGAPFKLIGDLFGRVRLNEIRRQRDEWSRETVHQFAEGKAEQALKTYLEQGLLHIREKRADVIKDLIDVWSHDRTSHQQKIILATTNEAVRDLNRKAQEARFSFDELGKKSIHVNGYDVYENDRVMFTKNEKQLKVKNGYFGTVRTVNERTGEIVVKLDSGELRKIPTAEYQDIQLGYALTTHKAQGKTVDSCYVLAGGWMQDRELTYVQMSRHRDVARLYTSVEDAGQTIEHLAEMMNRTRQKESAIAQQMQEKEATRQQEQQHWATEAKRQTRSEAATQKQAEIKAAEEQRQALSEYYQTFADAQLYAMRHRDEEKETIWRRGLSPSERADLNALEKDAGREITAAEFYAHKEAERQREDQYQYSYEYHR